MAKKFKILKVYNQPLNATKTNLNYDSGNMPGKNKLVSAKAQLQPCKLPRTYILSTTVWKCATT